MRQILLLVVLLAVSSPSFSAMKKQSIEYKDGDVSLTGTLLFDDAYEGRRAGILVLPEMWGINDFAVLRAEMLAETGYVAFIADLYGEGKTTRKLDEAKQWQTGLTSDRDTWIRRAKLGLQQLQAQKNVDSGKVALLGLNLGGITAIKLAATEPGVKGTAMMHAPIQKVSDIEVSGLTSKLLVLQGGSDASASFSSMARFAEMLSQHHVHWEMVVYGGAKQSFSDPYADSYGLENVSFSEDAERKSWDRVLLFFEALFEEELIL